MVSIPVKKNIKKVQKLNMREAKCLNCYLIEIHVSTIRFSVYYQQYTNSIFSFVQRGIGNIKTQYTLVRHTRTRLLNTFHPYFKFQGSLFLCSDQLSPPLSRTQTRAGIS